MPLDPCDSVQVKDEVHIVPGQRKGVQAVRKELVAQGVGVLLVLYASVCVTLLLVWQEAGDDESTRRGSGSQSAARTQSRGLSGSPPGGGGGLCLPCDFAAGDSNNRSRRTYAGSKGEGDGKCCPGTADNVYRLIENILEQRLNRKLGEEPNCRQTGTIPPVHTTVKPLRNCTTPSAIRLEKASTGTGGGAVRWAPDDLRSKSKRSDDKSLKRFSDAKVEAGTSGVFYAYAQASFAARTPSGGAHNCLAILSIRKYGSDTLAEEVMAESFQTVTGKQERLINVAAQIEMKARDLLYVYVASWSSGKCVMVNNSAWNQFNVFKVTGLDGQ
ncbi:uncharacterized protein LOC141910071 [Tubulanus polymorphus]|uniref:uncharacterized protein LOC141910071 n=1 Tax=Tubulanus polymorphus TaxID=672921 RepID=UPI003DA55DC7